MKIRKELWFGLTFMAIIVCGAAFVLLRADTITNGHLGLLMLALVVVAIMLGFPTAFTLMGMGMIFTWFAYDRNTTHTLDLMVQSTFKVMSNDVLISIPLFVFMGYLVERGDVLVLHVHHFLQLVDVHFFHVLLARGPVALADALHAAHDLHDALQQQREAGQRNDVLEGIQRQRFGREGLLADGQRLAGIDPARIGQGHDARQEEHDVEHQVDRGLRAGAVLLLQGVVEIVRCVVCLRDGYWPAREADVEEVDVDKLKEMVHVKDEDIAALDNVDKVVPPAQRQEGA